MKECNTVLLLLFSFLIISIKSFNNYYPNYKKSQNLLKLQPTLQHRLQHRLQRIYSSSSPVSDSSFENEKKNRNENENKNENEDENSKTNSMAYNSRLQIPGNIMTLSRFMIEATRYVVFISVDIFI